MISIRIIVDCSQNLMEGAFFPGEIIRGEIIFYFKKKIKARSLSAHYIGVENSYVRRTESSPSRTGSGSHTVTYHDFNYYFHVEDIFLEPNPGEEYLDLKGEYKYNFNFKIPEDVPGTFQIDDSSIKYLIDVKVDIPRRSDIHKTAEIIILPNSIIKVKNQEPYALLKAEESVPECELFCNSQIYKEQENIEINLNINKNDKQKFREIKVALEYISTKTAQGYTDTFPNIINSCKISKKQVQQGNNSFVFNYEIPYGSPVSIYGMFMKRELFVHLKMDRKYTTDRHLWIPIYILPAV